MNTYQGSQYKSSDWVTVLNNVGIRISMDGKGRYLDNIFIVRLRQSLKQESIYLHEMNGGFHANQIIDDWMVFYNTDRPHTALDKRTPDEVYFKTIKARIAA